MIQERQKTILEALVREHIRTGRPVSSKEIIQEYSLDFSPATVRNEMQELDSLGYLIQPHTSAGRIPTDKGYRFFVDYLARPEPLNAKEKKKVDGVFAKNEAEDFVEGLANAMAEFAGVFALAGIFDEDISSWRGFSRVMEDPSFTGMDNARSFARLLDKLDEQMGLITKDIEIEHQKIFIGQENPFDGSDCLSMMVSSWEHPAGFEGFITLVGPKRMDYQKSLSLLKYIQNF